MFNTEWTTDVRLIVATPAGRILQVIQSQQVGTWIQDVCTLQTPCKVGWQANPFDTYLSQELDHDAPLSVCSRRQDKEHDPGSDQ